MSVDIEQLKELGLVAAADKIEKKLDLKRKLLIAYENYRFVSPEITKRFQEELKKKTFEIEMIDKNGMQVKWVKKPYKKDIQEVLNHSIYQKTRFDQLSFIKLKEYGEVPPAAALSDLKTAQERGVFDEFEVAKIESHQKVEDPIIFGKINGCDDRFYVTQWLNDVSIEDILRENEG